MAGLLLYFPDSLPRHPRPATTEVFVAAHSQLATAADSARQPVKTEDLTSGGKAP